MKLKIKKPNYVVLICILIIVISLIIIFNLEDRTMDASQVLTIATALIGVVTLGYEMRRTKNIAEAEFLVNLNTNFVENNDYKKTYDLLEKYDFSAQEDLNIPNSMISNYLTFFETFQLLIDRKVLKIEMIDDLFAYRFFLAVHNPYVQKVKLIKSPENFINIYKLEKRWMEYRQKNGKKCYRNEYCLSNKLPERYEEIINAKKKIK